MNQMWKTAGHVGNIFAALSVAILVTQGFELGISAPLKSLFHYYDAIVNLAVGWVDPYIKILLKYISDRLSLHFDLHPHWRHIFVLMSLYFGTEVKTDFSRHRMINAVIGIVSGTLIALIASIGAGAVAVNSPTLNLIVVCFPIGGFILYALIACLLTSTFYAPPSQTWCETFLYYLLTTALPYLAAAVLAVLIGVMASDKILSPNLISVGSFLLLITAYWLSRGAWLAMTDRQPLESWMHRFLRTGGARFGSIILRTIGIAAIVVASSAGLNQVGL